MESFVQDRLPRVAPRSLSPLPSPQGEEGTGPGWEQGWSAGLARVPCTELRRLTQGDGAIRTWHSYNRRARKAPAWQLFPPDFL
jgi:hypothetical protein